MRIVKETGKPVARDLGINPYTLHNWMKADRERESAGEALSESEREGLARLRRHKAEWARERAELEMERDVLKRSAAGWVKDSMNR